MATPPTIRPARLQVSIDGTHVTRPLVEVATGTPITVIGTIDVVHRQGDGRNLRLVGADEATGVVQVHDAALMRAHGHQLVVGREVMVHGRVRRDRPASMPVIEATAITV